MADRYARGGQAWGICDRCGQRGRLITLPRDGYQRSLRVHPECREVAHPQENLHPVKDALALWKPRPENWRMAATLSSSEVVDGMFTLTWSALSDSARIKRYELFALEPGGSQWELVGTFTPTYDMFSSLLDPANTTDLPVTYYQHQFMLVASDAAGGVVKAYHQNSYRPPILSIVAVDQATGDITLAWTETSGSSQYAVQHQATGGWVTINTVDGATLTDIASVAYINQTMRVVATVAGTEVPSNEVVPKDFIDILMEFHGHINNTSTATHPYSADESSFRETYPGGLEYTRSFDERDWLGYGHQTDSTPVYGTLTADANNPAGTTAYLTPTVSGYGTIRFADGWNPVHRFVYTINGNFDGSNPRVDFQYVSAPGVYTPLTTQTARNGRGFRLMMWQDETGAMYVMESNNPVSADRTQVVVIKKFAGINATPQISTTYQVPTFLATGSTQGDLNRTYGLGEVYIPELGYIYQPYVQTQNSDTANNPHRIPFNKDWDINQPLVGEQMSGVNGAVSFSYSPELGILVAGRSQSYSSSTAFPCWSEDAGATWTVGVDISYSGTNRLHRTPNVYWVKEIQAFIAFGGAGSNGGSAAYISHDGKNWILLGRFYGTTTINFQRMRHIPSYFMKPVAPEYAKLQAGVGSNNMALSNNDMTITFGQSNSGNRSGTLGKVRGKWYWEVSIGSGNATTITSALRVGVLRRGIGSDIQMSYLASHGAGFIVFCPKENWNLYNESSTGAEIGAGTAGAIGTRMGFALDLDNWKLWVAQDGAWLNGDPASNTGGLTIPPSCYTPSLGANTPSTGGGSLTFHSTPDDWAHAAPVGFAPLTRWVY